MRINNAFFAQFLLILTFTQFEIVRLQSLFIDGWKFQIHSYTLNYYEARSKCFKIPGGRVVTLRDTSLRTNVFKWLLELVDFKGKQSTVIKK